MRQPPPSPPATAPASPPPFTNLSASVWMFRQSIANHVARFSSPENSSFALTADSWLLTVDHNFAERGKAWRRGESKGCGGGRGWRCVKTAETLINHSESVSLLLIRQRNRLRLPARRGSSSELQLDYRASKIQPNRLKFINKKQSELTSAIL